MSTQMPFLICQQYVLRCPLLMGEDSNKMGFCEAKMSFSHTNEAGLTGLEVSSRGSNPKDTMDLPILYKRSHLLHVVTGVGPKRFSAASSCLTYHSPSPAHTARLGSAEGTGADREQRTPWGSWFYFLTRWDSEATPDHQRQEGSQWPCRKTPLVSCTKYRFSPLTTFCLYCWGGVSDASHAQEVLSDHRLIVKSRSSLSPRSKRMCKRQEPTLATGEEQAEASGEVRPS